MSANSLNTVIVFIEDGEPVHRFVNDQAALNIFNQAVPGLTGASMFKTDTDNAQLLYDISPNFKARVESAKNRLRHELYLKSLLDKHGVPEDLELRFSVFAAMKELEANLASIQTSFGVAH